MLQQYHNILVAVDGSEEAELAFKKAVQVAKRNEAKLYLVHVIDTRAFQSVSSFDGAMAEQAEELAKKTMAEYVAYAEKNEVKDVTMRIEFGSPKIVIAKELPAALNIDLIMLGATGMNAIERVFIGSVSEHITRQAVCDVLIVRTDLDNQLVAKEK